MLSVVILVMSGQVFAKSMVSRLTLQFIDIISIVVDI